ncbi:hypothetical protein CGI13_23585 [Vibrio parahaemolyticus]|nr:hypothetical protein CGI13_23585 [Vibrio parahaemolyticus]
MVQVLLILSFRYLLHCRQKKLNKAFKSDSQRLALSLRSSIAKRRSHLNLALCVLGIYAFRFKVKYH